MDFRDTKPIYFGDTLVQRLGNEKMMNKALESLKEVRNHLNWTGESYKLISKLINELDNIAHKKMGLGVRSIVNEEGEYLDTFGYFV